MRLRRWQGRAICEMEVDALAEGIAKQVRRDEIVDVGHHPFLSTFLCSLSLRELHFWSSSTPQCYLRKHYFDYECRGAYQTCFRRRPINMCQQPRDEVDVCPLSRMTAPKVCVWRSVGMIKRPPLRTTVQRAMLTDNVQEYCYMTGPLMPDKIGCVQLC